MSLDAAPLYGDLMTRVARELGLDCLGALAGGLLGAFVVRRGDEGELVLKALPPTSAVIGRFHDGPDLAEILRLDGYPAPRYVDKGTLPDGTVWSLQQLLPG